MNTLNLFLSLPSFRATVARGLAWSVFGAMVLAIPFPMGAQAPAKPAAVESRPESKTIYTNAVPVAIFEPSEKRDPFVPVGYQKPKPAQVVAQVVEVEIAISGTSFAADGTPLAMTKGGGMLEVGGVYTFKSKDGKASVTYKVLKIVEDAVTIQYNDKEKVFKLESSSIDQYKEKEGAP